MNREQDFHRKQSGTLINGNTKDYYRAKNRRKFMAEHKAALGEGGELKKVSEKFQKFATQPSRADERVRTLEEELLITKHLNKKMQEQLDDTKKKLDEALKVQDEFAALKQLVKERIRS